MAELYRFFDSTAEDPRYYQADEFAEYFRQILTNGILNGGTNLQVTADGATMVVTIDAGYAWIEGYLYKVDAEKLTLLHAGADPTLDRIDRVVIRLDKTNRHVKAFILQGTADASPTAPELTRNDDVYEISLAQVRIIAGKSFLENNEVTDERLDENVCGLVNSLIQVDTATMQAEFDAFMSTLEGQSYVSETSLNTKLSSMLKISSNILIQSANWVDDTATSGLWHYEITDAEVDANTVVDFAVHLADLEKASDLKNITQSFSGYFRLYAEAQPTQDILMDIKKVREVT